MPSIGYLSGGSAAPLRRNTSAFVAGLKEAGYADGQNVTVDYLWAENRLDRLPAFAAQLVGRPVSLIAAAGTSAALAAKAATTVIPIVFETAGDPVKLGLVASINRPGGNATGVTQLSSELVAKRLGVLHDLLPAAKTVGLLVDPNDPRAETQSNEIEEAARALGLQIRILKASTAGEIDTAFVELTQPRADALMVGSGNLLDDRREQVAALAAKHRVPSIYQYRDYVAAGGLMSYGASRADSYRLAGVYAGRVLKGEKPADLPVARTTKFELVINLKTANALGLTIPPSLFAQADEVIE
ncbi:MAG TPA: ABC transporter substrate-binding protein [Stellaceae bacterium]|nr:ABC transporter substrate-binding protein [Stellaceae bacterium]